MGANASLEVYGPLVISRSRSGRSGGAAFASMGGTLRMYDVHFDVNYAGEDGGAIGANESSLVNVTCCLFTENSCGGGGGAVTVESYFYGYWLNFTKNVAGFDGGGLRGFVGSTVNLAHCYFHENRGVVSATAAVGV